MNDQSLRLGKAKQLRLKTTPCMYVYVSRGADVMENLSPQQRAQLEMNQVGLGRTLREEGSRRYRCKNGRGRVIPGIFAINQVVRRYIILMVILAKQKSSVIPRRVRSFSQ